MEEVEQFCPAKLNLFLAITGRREDGFHELVSLMVPLDFGDRLRMTWSGADEIAFSCDDDSVPLGRDNLVVRAIERFRERFPLPRGLRVVLEKRIPSGAGLGGGSSDATGALLALNRLAGSPASRGELHVIAASIGSDCPFFLENGPAIVRGRGERIEPLPVEAAARLRGKRFLLLKPSFSIDTAWAYQALGREADPFVAPEEAEPRLAESLGAASERSIDQGLFNSLERPVFRKFIALPTLKARLDRLGLPVRMSGSGSTLFACLDERDPREDEARRLAEDAYGDSGWIRAVRVPDAG